MVTNPPCFTHAACRNDDLRVLIHVEHLRICGISRKLQIREIQRMVTAQNVAFGFFVENLCILFEYFGRRRRHRAVDVDVDIAEDIGIFRMMLVEHIELIDQLLRSADCKRRNDDIAAALDRLQHNLNQLVDTGRVFFVQSIAVGRLHDDIVGFFDFGRIAENRTVWYTEISGKHQLGSRFSLGRPQLDDCRAENMSRIIKDDLHIVIQRDQLIVENRLDKAQRRLRVADRIKRLYRRLAGSCIFPALPFRILFVNIGTVLEHHI